MSTSETTPVKLSSLVSAITTVATCSEDKDVNLEALLTLGQVLSPAARPIGRRRGVAYDQYEQANPRMQIVDDFEDEGDDQSSE